MWTKQNLYLKNKSRIIPNIFSLIFCNTGFIETNINGHWLGMKRVIISDMIESDCWGQGNLETIEHIIKLLI